MVLVQYSGNARLHELDRLLIADAGRHDEDLALEPAGARALHEVERSFRAQIHIEQNNARACDARSESPSVAELTCPATVKSGSLSSMRASPSRNMTWSSTSRIRIVSNAGAR